VAALLAGVAGARLAVTLAPLVAGLPDDLRRRWYLVPALVWLVVPVMVGVRREWSAIWLLWGLMAALLVLALVTAALVVRGPTSLPPVWLLWLLAWGAGVAGWSPRDLRVEVFSLPLGLALLGVGVIGLRAARGGTPSRPPARDWSAIDAWPSGRTRSWPLLAPGLIATFLPSMTATGTDPQTWRAITVLALALAAILVGSLFRLAAPFLLGIAVLPIENIVVFAVQVGGTISATSWWITLATAGAVLLVIAVTWERRSGGDRGIAARLRDLR
jgi:hypothetical protein